MPAEPEAYLASCQGFVKKAATIIPKAQATRVAGGTSGSPDTPHSGCHSSPRRVRTAFRVGSSPVLPGSEGSGRDICPGRLRAGDERSQDGAGPPGPDVFLGADWIGIGCKLARAVIIPQVTARSTK